MTDGIYINQETQDIDVNLKGNIVNDNALITEIYARLSTPLGTYRYDPNFGSTIPFIIQNRQKITINVLKNAIVNALLPMVNRGSIINIDFILITLGIGAFSVQLTVTDSNSNTFNLPYSVQG
jgi:phage baseplate assembly protein W